MPLTEQILLDLRGKVRDRDPETSWAAAASISLAKYGQVKQAVLAILEAEGPLTHDGIFKAYEKAGGTRTAQRVRTATKELHLAGLVRPSNVAGISDHGGDSQRWELVEVVA